MRKIKMGMVGGGPEAFIGAIHRAAAQMDGQIELVCGAFSSNAQKSFEFGRSLYLEENRCYNSYQEMFEQEATKPIGERMDFVAIVTPNYLHFPIAQLAFEKGFHVISDKPATMNLDEAIELRKIIDRTGLLYALTHTYTGYPMVKEAKQRIADGELGNICKVLVEYPQGWLASKESEGSKQASWRLDPEQSGVSCCMADIGVHAANLAEYVTGLKIDKLCADLSTSIDGRKLDDDGVVLIRFDSGARGVLMASQVLVGEENNLNIRVYGDRGSLQWSHQAPNDLVLRHASQPMQIVRAGTANICDLARENSRTPTGHPEGYIEAFANIYVKFSEQVRAKIFGGALSPFSPLAKDVPGIHEAIRGMAFIESVVSASESETKWHHIQTSSQI